jgi:Rrf2 family protein
MVHLAGQPPGTRISRDDLARAAECPEQFLSKVLQGLTRAGLVVSHRGNVGGFELPETHRAASVLDVVEAIEGPLHLNICVNSDQVCTRQSWCPVHPVWIEAQSAMAAVLKASTVEELAQRAQAGAEQIIVGPRWN